MFSVKFLRKSSRAYSFLPAIDALIPTLGGFLFSTILLRRDLALFNDFTVFLLVVNLFTALGNSVYNTPIHYRHISKARADVSSTKSSIVLFVTLACLIAAVAQSESNSLSRVAIIALAISASISANTIRSLLLKSDRVIRSLVQGACGLILSTSCLIVSESWTRHRPDRLLAIYALALTPRILTELRTSHKRSNGITTGHPEHHSAMFPEPRRGLPFITLTMFVATTGSNILASLLFSRTLGEEAFASVRIAEISLAPISVYLSANIAFLTNSKWSQATDLDARNASAIRAIRQLRLMSGVSLLPAVALVIFLSQGVLQPTIVFVTFVAYIPGIFLQSYIPIRMNLLLLDHQYVRVLQLCALRILSIIAITASAVLSGLAARPVALPLSHLFGSVTIMVFLFLVGDRKRSLTGSTRA